LIRKVLVGIFWESRERGVVFGGSLGFSATRRVRLRSCVAFGCFRLELVSISSTPSRPGPLSLPPSSCACAGKPSSRNGIHSRPNRSSCGTALRSGGPGFACSEGPFAEVTSFSAAGGTCAGGFLHSARCRCCRARHKLVGSGLGEHDSIGTPSALCGNGVSWAAGDQRLHARFLAHSERARVDYAVRSNGGLETVCMLRWGNPNGGEFHYSPFGGSMWEESTYAGYTIPTRMRVGWRFGADDFE